MRLIESVHRTSSATLPAVMRRQDGVTLCDGLTADSDVINKFTPTEFTHHRDNSMQKVYIDKLSDSNIWDSYAFQQAVFSPLTSSELPYLHCPDVVYKVLLLWNPIKIYWSCTKVNTGAYLDISTLLADRWPTAWWQLPSKKDLCGNIQGTLFAAHFAASHFRVSKMLRLIGKCASKKKPNSFENLCKRGKVWLLTNLSSMIVGH